MASKFTIFCDDDIQQQPTTHIHAKDELIQASQTTTAVQNNGQELANNKQQLLQYNQQQQLKERQLDNPNVTRREPLGVKKLEALKLRVQQQPPLPLHNNLNQHHNVQQRTVLSQQQQATNNQPNNHTQCTEDKDQENDISMISLCSDFDPSLLHQSHHQALTDDEDDENVYSESSLRFEESFQADEDLNDLEYDDELMIELNSAFKQQQQQSSYKNIEYVADIMDYLTTLERTADVRPIPNYLKAQSELDSNKRKTLIDWMIEVADEFRLQTETLFITVNLIDRFLSGMNVSLTNFQLLGVASMFTASKYEEIHPPDLHLFVEITDETYSGEQIRSMELELLKALDFRLSMPTSIFFVRKIVTFNKFTKKVFHMAEYLCYLALLEDKPFLEYYPSEIAHAAVILAANELDLAEKISPELKSAFDQSNIDQIERIEKDPTLPLCIESLLRIQSNAELYKSAYAKFSADEFECVALHKPNVDLAQVVA